MPNDRQLASDSTRTDPACEPALSDAAPAPRRIPGLRRVHCGTHKCLTIYFQKVFKHLCRGRFGVPGGFKHFFSYSDDFYRECDQVAFASISNHVLDLDRFEDVRVTRFIRDPRDLIVSAYYYHRRSGEKWCDVVDPTDADLAVVAGTVPSALPRGKSVAQYLNEVSLEEGLAAEFDFRRKHFQTMLDWPEDARVRIFRYEDIVGQETRVFDEIFRHYELPGWARLRGLYYARKFRAARRQTRTVHIRNPALGQWRTVFTPALKKRFDAEYGPLLEKLGYPAD